MIFTKEISQIKQNLIKVSFGEELYGYVRVDKIVSVVPITEASHFSTAIRIEGDTEDLFITETVDEIVDRMISAS